MKYFISFIVVDLVCSTLFLLSFFIYDLQGSTEVGFYYIGIHCFLFYVFLGLELLREASSDSPV
ncbi:hypothetical protein [Halobacillus faecis]|uniref:Uncharacterized protein n=1 Tax=Halobacillus faecis TaxID=360184 RepID=A0A511WWK3_9BACI|nr:hypothetical protein [Halobacillus faecis]GEN55515.1 hypothetical protein HFA01_37770 [Halobacillus faecis]